MREELGLLLCCPLRLKEIYRIERDEYNIKTHPPQTRISIRRVRIRIRERIEGCKVQESSSFGSYFHPRCATSAVCLTLGQRVRSVLCRVNVLEYGHPAFAGLLYKVHFDVDMFRPTRGRIFSHVVDCALGVAVDQRWLLLVE